MIECKLKPKTGMHLRKESGKGLRRYMPGDIMLVESIDELGGAKDKFDILTSVEKEPEEKIPSKGLEAQHKGKGRYVVINTETKEAVHEGFLTKKEAQAMAIMPFPSELEPEPEIKKGARRRKNA